MTTGLVLSCEHASAAVPARFRSLFDGQAAVLQSHRGWDPGTLELGKRLSKRFQVPLLATKVSRLLIEVNRSLHHPKLFSEYTSQLPAATKQLLIEEYYLPHREAIEQQIRVLLQQSHRVLHLSLHSFTGQWNGQPRTADLGLLYDPRRATELSTCCHWQASLQRQLPGLVIRRNYPYLGKADGLTTALRKKFAMIRYLGIELEVNQNHTLASRHWTDICRALEATIPELLGVN
ncbi:MAG: N-formylglutamate amidohydrolase [Pirellulaceae bacterium]|nr:N-formylglutamate amidohydrolase [Pirellulaceae bacterium]